MAGEGRRAPALAGGGETFHESGSGRWARTPSSCPTIKGQHNWGAPFQAVQTLFSRFTAPRCDPVLLWLGFVSSNLGLCPSARSAAYLALDLFNRGWTS